MPVKKIILIVEDNLVNLELFQLILEMNDYEVLSATKADSGIELAKSHHPDLILMDMRLPGMNGADAVKLLKQDHATSNIPVVVLTGDVMLQNRDTALQNGFVGYIPKPIDTRQFADLVSDYLQTGAGSTL